MKRFIVSTQCTMVGGFYEVYTDTPPTEEEILAKAEESYQMGDFIPEWHEFSYSIEEVDDATPRV